MIAAARRSPLPVPEPARVAATLNAEREVARLRAFLEHVAEVVDTALDAGANEAADLLAELSDAIRAELRT